MMSDENDFNEVTDYIAGSENDRKVIECLEEDLGDKIDSSFASGEENQCTRVQDEKADNLESENLLQSGEDKCHVELEAEETTNEDRVNIEDNNSNAPDGGWGWFVVLGAFLNHVILGGYQRSSGVTYLQLREKFQMSATSTSWVPALSSTMTLFMGPIVSAFCTKFSIRFVVFLGAIMATVGTFISGFSPNLGFLYFSFGILTGFGRAMVYSPGLVMVGKYFNKRRGLAVGLATCGGGFGNFFFPPMFEKLFEFYGFRGAFFIFAAINSHFFISGALFRSLELQRKLTNYNRTMEEQKQTSSQFKEMNCTVDKRTDQQLLITSTKVSTQLTTSAQTIEETIGKRKLSEVKMAIKAPSKESRNTTKLLDLSLFKNYAFTTLCLQLLMFNMSFGVTFVFLPALAQTKGLTKIESAYLLSIIGISDALSLVLLSVILDLKKVKKFRLVIYNILMLLVGVLSEIIPLMKTFGQFSIICVAYGVTTGTCVSQKSVVIVDILGVEKLSSSFGLLLLFQGIGSLIGPVIGALFRDFLGSYDMSFYYGSIGIFVGAFLLATGNIWLYIQQRKAKQFTD